MSKKKKNSNYKSATSANVKTVDPDRRKNNIIWISCLAVTVVLLGSIIAAFVISSIPNTSYVEMDFGDYGKIVIEVDGDAAPITAENFIDLVNDGFYDGLTIFRAQENFVIQGGKDDSASITPIKGEFASNGHDNPISHTRGVISMARTNDPDSATSQFFITLHDSATYSLDGGYAAFGHVVEGMDVVDAIAEALLQCDSDSYGFVSDDDAITIVTAKVLENYK